MHKIEASDGSAALAANSNIVAAWLFGSAQSGEVQEGSDIDIGIFFESRPSLQNQVELMLALEEAYDFENIDLVVLNDASAILRFEAISGEKIFCRDVENCAGFVSLTAREYEYTMAMIQRALAWQKENPSLKKLP